MLNRRNLLRFTALVPVAIGLAACPELSKVASNAQVIADGVSAVLPTIQQVIGIKEDVVRRVTEIVAGIKSAAAALEGATGQGAMTLAQQVAVGVGALQKAVSGLTLPSWVSTVIQAAIQLAPVVLQVAGVVLAGPAPDPRATAQARAILVAAAAR